MSFGALLRSQRVAARKSLRALAQCLDLSPTYLSMVEREELPPFGADHIGLAARFIGCDAVELLQSAINDRSTVKLEASLSDAHREAATALAMNWNTLTRVQLRAIECIATGKAGR